MLKRFWKMGRQTSAARTGKDNAPPRRYPEPRGGLPAIPPDELVTDQPELTRELAEVVGKPRSEFDELLTPLIANYAAFVHLLPASEAHHHRGPGGLFRHGLEVAVRAGARADRTQFLHYRATTPRQRREEEPRWRMAAIVAGLLHDAAKAASDVRVVAHPDPQGAERLRRQLSDGHKVTEGQTWNPFSLSLHDWLVDLGAERYHIHWVSQRSGRHGQLAPLTLNLLPAATRAYLGEAGPVVPEALAEVLSGGGMGHNILGEIVKNADAESVAGDIKRRGDEGAADGAGRRPLEDQLMDLMQALVRDLWSANEPGSRLFRLDEEGLFVVWPAAGEDIAARARDQGIPGIPTDPMALAEVLVARGKATAWGAQRHAWPIRPACLGSQDPLWALRFTPAERLGEAPALVAGDFGDAVFGEGDEKDSEGAEKDLAPQSDEELRPSDNDGLLAPGGDAPDPADPSFSAEPPAPAEPPQPPPPEEPPDLPTASEPTGPVPPGHLQAAQQDGTQNEGSSQGAKKGTGGPEMQLAELGFVGEVLETLAEDLAEGQTRKWGEHAQDTGDRVILCHPEALKGYGEDTRSLVTELHKHGVIETDPTNPARKVQKAGGFKRALVLTKAASEAFRQATPAAPAAEEPGTSPTTSESEKEPGTGKGQAGVRTETESAEPPGPEPFDSPEGAQSQGIAPEEGADPSAPPTPKAPREGLEGEDLQAEAILSQLPSDVTVHREEDGRLIIPFARSLTRIYEETGISKGRLHFAISSHSEVEVVSRKGREWLIVPEDWLSNLQEESAQ